MALKSEKFGEILPSKPKSAEEAFAAYRKEERYDFSKIDAKEWPKVWKLYKANFDSLGQEAQSEVFEQILHLGVVKEEEALDLFSGLPKTERIRIAAFVARNVENDRYNHLFYEAWKDFDWDLKYYFKGEFLAQYPHKAFLVAPFGANTQGLKRIGENSFKHVRKKFKDSPYILKEIESIVRSLPMDQFIANPWKLIEPAFRGLDKKISRVRERKGMIRSGWMHDWRKRPNKLFEELKFESIFDVYINNFESAKKLFESYLWIYRRSSGKPETSVQDEIVLDETRKSFDETVEFLAKDNFSFVFPYLSAAVQVGLATQKRAEEIFDQFAEAQWGGFRYPSFDFYATREEKQRKKSLLEKAKEFNPDKKDDEIYNVEFFPVAPLSLVYKEKMIYHEALDRALRHTFSNFKSFEKTFSVQRSERVINAMIEAGLPLFCAIDLLGFDSSRVKRILMKGWAERFNIAGVTVDLRDAIRLIDAGHYKEVVDAFVRDLSEGDSSLGEKVVVNASRIFQKLGDKDKTRILDLINKFSYEQWFNNLDFALDYKPIDFKSLIKKSSDDGWSFLHHYNDLILHLSMRRNLGKETVFLPEDLSLEARNAFLKNPDRIFINAGAFKEVFSPDEQREFILGNLKDNPPPYFLEELLEEMLRNFEADQKNPPRYSLSSLKNEINGFFSTNSDMVFNLLDQPHSYRVWKVIKVIFSGDERFRLLVDYIIRKNPENLFEHLDNDLLFDIAGNDKYFEKFLEAFIPGVDIAPINHFLINIEEFLSGDAMAQKERRAGREVTRLLLSDKTRTNFLKGKAMASDYLAAFCENAKFAVFDFNIGKIKDQRLRDIAGREVEEYSEAHPEVLIVISLMKGEKWEAIYDKLLDKHWRYAVFSDQFYESGYRVQNHALNRIGNFYRARWDIMELENRFIDEDYYVKALKEISGVPFVKLYESRLREIAQEELQKYGERRNLENFRPTGEFVGILNRILLLNSSKIVVDYENIISNLEAKEQEEVLKFLDYILLYGLDNSDKFKYAIQKLELEAADGKRDLEAIFYDHLSKIFGVNIGEWGVRGAGFNIEGLRALTTFYGISKKDAAMRRGLKDLLREGLSGNYKEWRGWGISETEVFKKEDLFEVLKADKLLPQELNFDQYGKWLEDDSALLEEVLNYDEGDIQRGIRQTLYQAVADHHIEADQLDLDFQSVKAKYELITLPMQELTEKLGVFKKKIAGFKKSKTKERLTPEEEGEYKDLQNQIAEYKEEKGRAIRLLESQMYLSKLRHVTIGELQNQSLSIEGKVIPFKKAFEVLEESFSAEKPDFYQDVVRIRNFLEESFRNMFGGGRISKSVLRVSDLIDATTYLKIGEEPVPSCQSYKSSSGYNAGLLSYVVDSNVKIIQIHDESQKIIARSIMRLLADDNGNPQLFIERIYSVNAHHKIKEGIVNFAKNKAKKLGVGLFSHAAELNEELPDKNDFIVDLHSHNSRAPFVYTDAGGGKVAQGKYTIKGAFRII